MFIRVHHATTKRQRFSTIFLFSLSHAASYMRSSAVKMFSTFLRHPFFSYVFVFHDRRHKAKELLSRCGLDRRRKFFVLVLLFLFVNSPRMCKRKKKVGNTIAKSLVGGKKALSDG
jgi:hypothetical protein